MDDTQTRFATLALSAAPGIAHAIEKLVLDAPDDRLNRVNPLAFAAKHGFDERDTIAAFLHATRIGLFELIWSVLCPSCAGALHAGASLRSIDQDRYACTLCGIDSEPTLDVAVEVTFTVSPRIRKIAAHDPENLPIWDYVRQIAWSSGSELPDDFSPIFGETILGFSELAAGETTLLQLSLSDAPAILFDPMTHTSQIMQVSGAATQTPQDLTIAIEDVHHPRDPIPLQPGPLRLSLENRTSRRALPIIWVLDEGLRDLVSRRVPFLTAKQLLTHQTFRDIYRTDVLNIDQRFKITSLTFLFTDLKGSTELYERIGDLPAYDLVRAHFYDLATIVADEGGAVVKTIGDAVMATFPSPERGISAAIRMRDAMTALNARHKRDDILLKIGLHEGPCLAVSLNDRQDYFGQTVNIASRLQNLAAPRTILTTDAIAKDAAAAALIQAKNLQVSHRQTLLRGIRDEVATYEIA
jgi:class 3 adenylate cyclase